MSTSTAAPRRRHSKEQTHPRDYQRGDYVYYFHRNGDTYPGRIIEKSLRGSRHWPTFRIRYDGLNGPVEANVKCTNLIRQSDAE